MKSPLITQLEALNDIPTILNFMSFFALDDPGFVEVVAQGKVDTVRNHYIALLESMSSDPQGIVRLEQAFLKTYAILSDLEARVAALESP